MDHKNNRLTFFNVSLRCVTSLICTALLLPGDAWAWAAQQSPPAESETTKIPNDQLDSLVAPIALYPDPMLAQVLAASTYPLEIIQLHQWLSKNKNLKDKQLADAVMKQSWDPSVQGLAPMADLVKRLSDDIKWTTDLGNAFLAQQNDVMDAIQRMRAKAKDKGTLKSSEQQRVETKVVENKTVIVVEQANPKVVYVPSYDPVVVYGAPAYPYPPIYYPPAGYYAAGMAISFGVGMAMGAAWGGGWGYNSNWGGGNNNININNNNNFVNNSNRQNFQNNRQNVGNGNRAGNGNSWQHNPQHRGAAPYGDRSTANKFGGSARGDSAGTRQTNNRGSQGRQQAGSANRTGAGAGTSNRAGGAATNFSDRGGAGGPDRGSTGSANRGSNSGGGDRVGNRSVSSPSSSRGSGSAFSGSSSRSSGSSASRSSSRGSSSMGSRGGGSRGGGGGRRR